MLNKSDIRILFKKTLDGKITDYHIAEFKPDQPDSWPMQLYKEYDADIGNGNSYWARWNIHDIFQRFFNEGGFETKELAMSFFRDIINLRYDE